MTEHLISLADARSDLLACSAYLAESIRNREGRAQAMTVVVPHYLERGNVDLAAQLADTVDDPFVRDRLLIAVAEKCAATGDDEYALQLADAIEDLGSQSQARERIALQMAAKGNFEQARETAGTLNHRDAVLAGIAIKQHSDGDQNAANATVAEIEFPGLAAQAWMAMASADIESGRFETASGLLEKAGIAAEDIEHSEEKIRTLSDIGGAFIAAKRNDKAIEILEKARAAADALGSVHRDGFLGNAALGFLRAGSIDLADQTLDSVADKTQIASCLLGFAREYWRTGEHDEALEALDESYAVLRSQHERETRDTKAKCALFASIAAQYAGFEKGERALAIATEIPDESESTSALGQVARIMAIQKNDDVLQQALAAIPNDADRMFALILLSDTAAANGEKETAGRRLDEARALAEEVSQIASRSSAYNTIADRFVELGDEAKAREVAWINLSTILLLKDESSAAASLSSLAGFYAKAKFEIEEAETKAIEQFLRYAATH